MIQNDHKAHRKTTRRQLGFTLVEIMVVIVILGLLATIVGPAVMRHVFTSEDEVARQSVGQIHESVKLYFLENRQVPTLEQLITPDDKNRVYLEGFSEAPKDPWGSEYEIRKGEDPGTWEVISYGRDKTPDTDDDISSKTLKDRKKS